MIYFKVYDFMTKNRKIANIPHKAPSISMLILLICLTGCFGLKPSPLNQAAWDNDVEQIKALIDSGAYVDEVAPCPRKIFKVFAASPLDLAILQGNLEAVKALLDAGAEVNFSRYCHAITTNPEKYPTTPSQGYYAFKGSALMLSSLIGNLEISKLLLESGADPNQLTVKGSWQFSELNEFDALSFSAELGHSDITKLLLKYGADPSTSSYRALDRGRLNYLILLLEENALEIEFDPEYMHYNAELAHLAADFYAQTEEEKSLQFYKQAIKLYPGAAKNYKLIANGKWLKEFGKVMLAACATTLNQYAGSQGINSIGSFVGSNYYIYRIHYYDPNWTEEEYFRAKAKQSVKNQTLCQEIVACYEENKPNVAMADCVKETFKEEGKKLSTQ